jgi:hypothetical protein
MGKLVEWKLVDSGFLMEREEWEGRGYKHKKGRGQVEQNMADAGAAAKQQNANSQAQYQSAADANAKNLADSQPGSLTPAAQAQLASDKNNIANTYNGIRQTAFQTLGQRGMGSAPSGFGATAENAVDLGEANAGTAAYRNAQVNTQNEQNFGTQEAGLLSGQQGNLGIGNIGQSTTAAMDRSQMGSTLGDIGQGLSTAAGIAGAAFGMANPGSSSPFSGGSPQIAAAGLGPTPGGPNATPSTAPSGSTLTPPSVTPDAAAAPAFLPSTPAPTSQATMSSMAGLGAAQANAAANPFSNIGKTKGGQVGSYGG